MSSPMAHLVALERRLQAAGWPAMTSWWVDTMTRFYASGRRALVLRVGRRGGKSSTLVRCAVLEALYGQHTIPPGDVGVCGVVSVSRDEANQRLRTVKAILDALKVKYRPIENGIELESRPVVFKVFAASISGVVGGTWIAAICDEVARWRDLDTGANPATEVLRSLRPTMAGMPNARIFLSSSPMGKQDAHAVAVDLGDTEFQSVAIAPTWVARPGLTQADCRALEPEDSTFQREYGCIPFDGSTSSLFTDRDLLAVTRTGAIRVPPETGATYFAAQDPANRGGNGWTLAIARSRPIDGGGALVEIVSAREWRAPRGGALDSDSVMREIAFELKAFGVGELWQDQWSFDALAAIAARHGITLKQQASTQASKVQHYDSLRRRVIDRTIELPDDRMVRADLLGVRKWIGKGGGFSIELEKVGGRHCDFASSIALVCWLVGERRFPGQGFLEWMAAEAKLAAGPSPLRVVDVPQELVLLVAPPQFVQTSTILSSRGASYALVGGRVSVKPDDVECLRALGFVSP